MFCKECGKLLKGSGEIRYCCGIEYHLERKSFSINYTTCPKCGSKEILETESKEFQEEIVQTFTTRVCETHRCMKCNHVW